MKFFVVRTTALGQEMQWLGASGLTGDESAATRFDKELDALNAAARYKLRCRDVALKVVCEEDPPPGAELALAGISAVLRSAGLVDRYIATKSPDVFTAKDVYVPVPVDAPLPWRRTRRPEPEPEKETRSEVEARFDAIAEEIKKP